MFREMRRKDRILCDEKIIEILEKGTHGILSLYGMEGYPYGVPVSYAYDNGKIYFHCAKEGHKIDSINENPKVSFTVVDSDDVIPEKYSTKFASVIAFGRARIIESTGEMKEAHIPIINKYSKDFYEGGVEYMNKAIGKMCMVEITIEYVTGKGN